MKNYEIKASCTPVTESDIARFENTLGFVLPYAYKKFLMEHNGGFPRLRCFEIADGLDFVIHQFLPLSESAKPSIQLELISKPDSNTLLIKHLPIAELEFSNYLYIDRDNASIVAWSHNTDEIHHVATGFSEFMSMLVPLDNDPVFDYLTDDQVYESMKDIAVGGNVTALEELLSEGFDINFEVEGFTIFNMACGRKDLFFVKKLAELGAAKSGGLHRAVFCYAIDTALWLINEGVAINELDHKGKTPLDYSENAPVLKSKLLELGAKHALEL